MDSASKLFNEGVRPQALCDHLATAHTPEVIDAAIAYAHRCARLNVPGMICKAISEGWELSPKARSRVSRQSNSNPGRIVAVPLSREESARIYADRERQRVEALAAWKRNRDAIQSSTGAL